MKTIICLIISAITLSTRAEPSVDFIGVDANVGGARATIVPETASLIHTAQFLPVNKSGKITLLNDVGAQTDQALLNIKTAVNQITRTPVFVKLNLYVTKAASVPEVRKAVLKFFSEATRPAISYVVTPLPDKDALIAVDAVIADWGKAKKTVVRLHTNPYPGAEKEAQLAVLPPGAAVYISGQAKESTNLALSTSKTLESLGATLAWLKLKKSDVVQIKAFMQPMTNAGVVQEEITKFFGDDLTPPSVFVEWTSKKPQIEIELIAAAGDFDPQAPETVSYSTPPGMTPAAVYSKVAKMERGKHIYFSNFTGGNGTGEEQIKTIFATLTEWAGKAGTDLQHLVKATYYVTDNDAGNQLNILRPMYYDPKRPPAATKAMVKSVGLEERTVMVDMIAVTK